MTTPVALASWSVEETQKLRLDVDLTGTLSMDVAPTTPPVGVDTDGPDVIHYDFDGDFVLDDNGQPV